MNSYLERGVPGRTPLVTPLEVLIVAHAVADRVLAIQRAVAAANEEEERL